MSRSWQLWQNTELREPRSHCRRECDMHWRKQPCKGTRKRCATSSTVESERAPRYLFATTKQGIVQCRFLTHSARTNAMRLLLHAFTSRRRMEWIGREQVDLLRQIQFTPPSLFHLEGLSLLQNFSRFSRMPFRSGEYTDFCIGSTVTLVTLPCSHSFTSNTHRQAAAMMRTLDT